MAWNEKLKRDIPSSWAVKTIDDVVEVYNGATPSTADEENYGGGVTLVGERGPELVNLPKGADVYTATQTANAFRNSRGGGGGVTIQHMEVHNDVDAHNVIEQIGWRLARG